MLKKIGKFIRRQLLKIGCVKRAVKDYRFRLQQSEYGKTWCELMASGGAVRGKEHKTLATVSDEGITVDYMDGRTVGRRAITPVFIDSVNWGGME